jgi:signal transduction histidine kinase
VVAGVVAVMGVLMAAQLAAVVADDTDARLVALDVAVTVVGLALIPLLWRRPAGAAVALGVLAALSPTATPPATMASFHLARWQPFRTAAWTAVVGVAAHLVRGVWRPIDGLSYGWYALLVIVVYGALIGWGVYAQARRQLMRSLAERARRAEAEQAAKVAEARRQERARLSREMHDVLAHRLSLLATFAGALEYRPDSSPERLARAAGVIRGGLHEALEEVRDVITLLRADDDGDDGTEPTSLRPPPNLLDLGQLIEECRDAGMAITVTTAGAAGPADLADVVEGLPAQTGRAAYRVVQEGMTNARRHAGGAPVHVGVTRGPGRLLVEVTNPASTALVVHGHGLAGLTERVQLAGGTLRTVADDGVWSLCARFGWTP